LLTIEQFSELLYLLGFIGESLVLSIIFIKFIIFIRIFNYYIKQDF